MVTIPHILIYININMLTHKLKKNEFGKINKSTSQYLLFTNFFIIYKHVENINIEKSSKLIICILKAS